MQNLFSRTASHGLVPWIAFISLLAFVIAGLFIGNLLGLVFLLPFYHGNMEEITHMLSNPTGSDSTRIPLLIIQGLTAVSAFVITPILFLKYRLKYSIAEFIKIPSGSWQSFFFTTMIVFSFMVVNSIFIQWNQNILLPEIFSGFEAWAQAKEKELEEITLHLTKISGVYQFALAFLVVAVLPGFGEELLFRGLIQNIFHKITKNAHAAIWISAFLFSLFHFQFYGLIPRMLLGALFGYLYWWSGSIFLAMFAHFLNNGFMLVMMFFNTSGIIQYDITDESAPSIWVILFFGAITGFLLIYFKKLHAYDADPVEKNP